MGVKGAMEDSSVSQSEAPLVKDRVIFQEEYLDSRI
jgi:hypothetical protein